jgi:hypothetical protein
VPTFEVVEMSKNLKTVRRELRAACEERWKLRDEVHNLKQELPPSRSAWGQWLMRKVNMRALCR